MLGGIDGLNSYPSALCVVFAIGSPHGVANLMDRISNQNIDFPNIIAPNVRFADDDNLKLGVGNIFSWDCHISCNVRIGNFNIFNGYITVGHDAIIGDFNSFMPGSEFLEKRTLVIKIILVCLLFYCRRREWDIIL